MTFTKYIDWSQHVQCEKYRSRGFPIRKNPHSNFEIMKLQCVWINFETSLRLIPDNHWFSDKSIYLYSLGILMIVILFKPAGEYINQVHKL